MKKVHQLDIDNALSPSKLLFEMERSGVMGAGRLGRATSILHTMVTDKDCTVFLGVAGALVPGGMREILIRIVEREWVDAFVTTGATLTHDLAESLGFSHLQGSALADDAALHENGLDRIYDSYMPDGVYTKMEDFFSRHADSLYEKPRSISEFLYEVGRRTPKRSILSVCAKKKVPIFCPALPDSGIGLMIWGRVASGKKVSIDPFLDMNDMMNLSFDSKRCGVVYLGGGVPKNFIQQTMQMAPKPARYGVQITMDRPEPGGSSGAALREGVSWGKMSKNGQYVDVIADVTMVLPVIYAALVDRSKKK